LAITGIKGRVMRVALANLVANVCFDPSRPLGAYLVMAASEPAVVSMVNDDRREEWSVAMQVPFAQTVYFTLSGEPPKSPSIAERYRRLRRRHRSGFGSLSAPGRRQGS
jgi:hypothetical protein